MMFRTHNDLVNELSEGNSLQGSITCSFNDLWKTFGMPLTGQDRKIDVKWVVLFGDGLVATIYNWKNGQNWLGQSGPIVEAITEWRIGGKSARVVPRIREILGNRAEELIDVFNTHDRLIE